MGKNKKAHNEYPFEHDEVIHYTLDGVSIHPVTGRKPLWDFTMRPMVTLKQLVFYGCDRRKLRMDQQHCNYSPILT
jgi:hypothetical protein